MKEFSLKQKIVSLVLKGIVVISALLGTFLSYYAGRDSFMGGLSVFMYFTIQSNLALAVICGIGFYLIAAAKEIRQGWYTVKLVGTVSITLTGIVFCFILAPTLEGEVWNIQNILTHVVVPAACIIDFFITGINSELKTRSIIYNIVPPLLYAVYAGIGYACKWEFAEGVYYPYFFLNWGSPAGAFGFIKEFPFMGCMWWIISLLIFLVLVGWGYLTGIRMLKKCR
ncbi:MAG: Pr6Pr family membrane protein [Treponema sp.]|nr:Pr6Pr family membrane protein [Treponema sp.]